MANYGIFGTGSVGQTIGSKLLELGHHVRLGARDATNEHATAWVKAAEDGGRRRAGESRHVQRCGGVRRRAHQRDLG